MIGFFAMSQPAALHDRTVGSRTAGQWERSRLAALLPNGFLPWAAFYTLRLWTRSDPASVARMLGADGFDADFGLDDRC